MMIKVYVVSKQHYAVLKIIRIVKKKLHVNMCCFIIIGFILPAFLLVILSTDKSNVTNVINVIICIF